MLKRLLCFFGLHWSGYTDGGMGDAMVCDVCGKNRYPENFRGIIIHPRTRE